MKKVAIIGTGLAGISAGYALKDQCEVTFYEKRDYPGGAFNYALAGNQVNDSALDLGFLIFREGESPLLASFLREIKIQTISTHSTFSVQHRPSGLEYSGNGLDGFFGQRINVFKVGHWQLVWQIHRFYREAEEVLVGGKYQFHSVVNYAKDKNYSEDFLNKFIYPLCGYFWPAIHFKMTEIPIQTLVRYMKKNGLWGEKSQGLWQTVKGGNRAYREKLLSQFPQQFLLNTLVTEVSREYGKVTVFDANGGRKAYDGVIMACHADQALGLLGGSATPAERWLLKEFQYHRTRLFLHTDSMVMPRNVNWALYNYRVQFGQNGQILPVMTCYLNELHPGQYPKDYFLTFNDPGMIDPDKILYQADVEFPLFSLGALKAQHDLEQLNVEGPVYFCGDYFSPGLSEDIFSSGLAVAKAILSGKP